MKRTRNTIRFVSSLPASVAAVLLLIGFHVPEATSFIHQPPMFSLGTRRCGHFAIHRCAAENSALIVNFRSFHTSWYLLSAKVDQESSMPLNATNIAESGNNIRPAGPIKKKVKPQVKGKTYRADRVLSNRGWGSRSECFEILKQRRVVQKFGNDTFPVLGPSDKISMEADIWIDNKIQVPLPPPLLCVYHKPKWVLSVMNDSKGRPNLGSLDFVNGMHPVGRLDYDTSGLILFSSDGSLTQKLLHPKSGIQKEYVALVAGSANEAELREKLADGVKTAMGTFPADLVHAKSIPADEIQGMTEQIIKNLPPEYDLDRLEEKGYLFFKNTSELSEVRLVVEEGKHRMVRKILANSGLPVVGLKRERIGLIHLGDLPPGNHRPLNQHELQWAKSLLARKIDEST